MTKRGMVQSGLIARTTIGLLSAAMLILFAPVAAATPESDADAAISAAWDAGGGATGPLGPKDGGVYPAGEGFGQNFAGGKIFFTPATGAHIMTGLILAKYESLGGPADSDLGFPTIDEGAGRAPDSRNTTFSAADKPVIFLTPDTGARVVRGPINAAWDKLGGSSGVLGVPAEDETYGGAVVTQKFTGGELSYDTKAKTFTTVPPDLAGQLSGLEIPDDPTSAINAARRAAGGALGPLGAAQGPPYPIGRDGLGQNFAGGKIFYSPETGANVVTGQVLAKYESVGGPEGDLGLPTTSEVDGGLVDREPDEQLCRRGQAGHLLDARLRRGHRARRDERRVGEAGRCDGRARRADGRSDRERRRHHPTLQRRRDLLGPGQEHLQHGAAESRFSAVRPAGSGTGAAQGAEQPGGLEYQRQQVVSMDLVVAARDRSRVVLVGLVVFASLRNRRRGADDGVGVDDAEPAFGAPPGYGTATTEHEPADDHSAEFFGDRYAREGLGSLSPASAGRDYQPASMSPWGSPDHVDEADTSQEPVAAQQDQHDEDEDPDKVDTAPTRIPTGIERDPLTDTGRHARIVIDEPAPNGTALHLPLDDPGQAPEGYPIKADTKSGLYWAPGSPLYDDASAEIWFASEEIARTNGFVRAN